MDLKLTRLSDIDFAEIIELHQDPRVLRHLPLADGNFDEIECKKWVESKESQWETNGYGPWALLIGGKFAGWGGLQCENNDADFALILSPAYWGNGKTIYKEIVKRAFGDMGLESITALLPPSRPRVKGMFRLGFQPDGNVEISGTKFIRYRLSAPMVSSPTDHD